MEFPRALAREAKRRRLRLGEREREAFETLHLLLTRWNARINLTGLKTPAAIARVLFVESLLAEQMGFTLAGPLLDVGSGAGFPGIPLAVRHPALRVTLLEARAKRAAFLREAVARLSLTNASVVEGRLEEAAAQDRLGPCYRFFALRAVGELAPFLPRLKALAGKEPIVLAYLKAQRLASCVREGRVAVIKRKQLSSPASVLAALRLS
jgi:16S rRNA (guanine527-N7)-methyltransferase